MSPGATDSARRIYVDMDDVLCQTARGFLELLKSSWGRAVEFDEIVSFDLGRSFDLTRTELEQFMKEAHDEDLLMDLAPMPGALEALEEWVRDGYVVEVVTGRPPSSETVSRAWLERHDVPFDSLTFLAKYSNPHSDEDIRRAKPLSAMAAGDYCLAVEDSRDMAHFLAAGLGLDVALLDRPWNRNGNEALPDSVVRCSGWGDLMTRFSSP
jgi:uncharacterized HAD superfamily protein